MQVSWIDADHIKGLVAQIAPQEPFSDEAFKALEIETAPNVIPEVFGEFSGFAGGWMEPVAPPSSPKAAEMTPTLPEEILPEDEPGERLHNPAAALPLSRIRDKLRAIRQRAMDAGILTRVTETLPAENKTDLNTPVSDAEEGAGDDTASPVTGDGDRVEAVPASAMAESASPLPRGQAFEVPQGSREDRLAAYATWARQVLSEDGGHLLVMSDDGEVLWGGEAKAGLVLSTMMAWGAAIRASAASACDTPPVIRQPLASGNVLTVIPCETHDGMIHAAVAAPAGLNDDLAQALREALCAAMHWPPQPREAGTMA